MRSVLISLALLLGASAMASAQAFPGVVSVGFETPQHIVCDSGCTSAAGGGLTDEQLRATPVPVSGTVTFANTSLAVTGTFWQATQPVSIASMPSTPVTGTFWQATQPVSLASMPSTPVTGTFWQATQPISVASLPNHGVYPVSATTPFSCGVQGIAASLTQCQAAASGGQSHYITGIYVQTTTTTSGTYAIQSGTGTNCGTTTTAVFPVSGTANRFNAPITTSAMAALAFNPPVKVLANHAICLIGVATNTISAQIVGYTQ